MKPKNIFLLAFLLMSQLIWASSHREAPLIANDPLADNTDVYAFRSPDNPDMITIVANYVPLQLPHGGPNYYGFGENIRYEIHIDNNINTAGDDIIYRFTFKKTFEDPSTFFYIRLGKENHKTSYTMERSMDGGQTFETIIENGMVPPNYIGDRSIQGAAGLNTTYEALFNQAILSTSNGEQVFCGPTDDPFFVDLGGVFDLGDMPRQAGKPVDGVGCFNVSTIALQIPIELLQMDGKDASQATNILDPDFVIGVWASASRPKIRTLDLASYGESYSGEWVQVSRLGMPLTNEVVIPIGFKDLWNATTPYDDLANLDVFGDFFYNPELALYMDDEQFGGAVPAFSPLRIQRNSLQSFDFGFGQDGLFSLKGNPAVTGTALDDAIFGTLLLPKAGAARSVDLWPIFHTGVPNLNPYQLASGKNGDPLATGKPFIHNFLPNGGDMLRLNMAVPPTPRDDPAFSSLGLVQAAVLGLTDPNFAGNTDLEFIPNMDGFPNGRRLEDDVTTIELQAVSGVVLAAIGLWYDDFTAGDTNPVTQDLIDVLSYSPGVTANDTTFRTSFPYLQTPWSGTGKCSGVEVDYTQPAILPPTITQGPPVANCKKIVRVNLGSDGTYVLDPSQLDAGSSADAGIASLSLSKTLLTCNEVPRYNNITLTVTDNNGKKAECTSLVRVSDIQDLPDNFKTTAIGQSKGESYLSSCSDAVIVKSKKTGSRASSAKDWLQFTSARLTGDFSLEVKTNVHVKFGVAGVMLRSSLDEKSKMVYAGISTVSGVRESKIEIGSREETGYSDPKVIVNGYASGQAGTTFRVERKKNQIKIFRDGKLLLTKWFTDKSLEVGFFTTARSNFTAVGNFKNIILKAFGAPKPAPKPYYPNANNTLLTKSINIWPNPARDILNIRVEQDMPGLATVEVLDLLGRQLYNQQVQDLFAGDRLEIDLSNHFKNGTYFLRISRGNAPPIFKEFLKVE